MFSFSSVYVHLRQKQLCLWWYTDIVFCLLVDKYEISQFRSGTNFSVEKHGTVPERTQTRNLHRDRCTKDHRNTKMVHSYTYEHRYIYISMLMNGRNCNVQYGGIVLPSKWKSQSLIGKVIASLQQPSSGSHRNQKIKKVISMLELCMRICWSSLKNKLLNTIWA